MIKKMFRSIGRAVKPFVNVPLWIGWKNLKAGNKRLSVLAKDVLSPPEVEVHPETYEEAIVRLNLDEAKLSERQKYFKTTAYIYLLVTIGVLIYALYLLLIVGTFAGFLTTSIMMAVSLALAFKQHFWYIQMREKQLGLTFREWFQATFMQQSPGK